jgi:hypothetical protein
MLGFTRNTGPLTWLAMRSRTGATAAGFVIGLLVELLIWALGAEPAFSSKWERVGFTLAMGLVGAFVAWWTAVRVRNRLAE